MSYKDFTRILLACIILVLPFIPAAEPVIVESAGPASIQAPGSNDKSREVAGPALQAANLVSVTTHHNDNARTGANLAETTLKVSNVNQYSFGKIFTHSVDSGIFTQPLIVPNLTINGAIHNVVFVASQNGTLYAFDADDPNASTPLWQRDLTTWGGSKKGVAPYRDNFGSDCIIYTNGYKDISGNIGVLSTPVIDTASNTLYVVNLITATGVFTYQHWLHAIDLTTGQEKTGSSFPGAPVQIGGVVDGWGSGTVNGKIAFDSSIQSQRLSLALANGKIYFGTAAYCDTGNFHGWLFAYNAANLTQTAVFNTSTDGWQAGTWQSGQAVTIDNNGFIYVMTGNGGYTAPEGGASYGNSVLRLSPNLTVTDYFTPYDQNNLNTNDLDLGSSGVLLKPVETVTGTQYIIGGGKAGMVYVMTTTNLSGYNPTQNNVRQSWPIGGSSCTGNCYPNIHGAPVYYNGPSGPRIYLWSESDSLKVFGFNTNTQLFNITPVMTGSARLPDYVMPGGFMAVSANGSTAGTGILWAYHSWSGANNAVVTGTLRAYDASATSADGGTTGDIWNSDQNPARDSVGWYGKFSPPTVVNGKVYVVSLSPDVNTNGQLVVYGLLIPKFITVTNGANQTQQVTQAFPNALSVKVADFSNSPISGTQVVFQAPVSGAGGTFSGGTKTYTGTTDINGLVTTTTFTANATAGSYSVTATTTSGNVIKTFSLSNTCNPNTYLILRNDDPGTFGANDCGTLSYAINAANSSGTPVNLTLPSIITLTGQVPAITNNKGITISGSCVTTTVTVGGVAYTRGLPGSSLVAGNNTVNYGLSLNVSNTVISGVRLSGFTNAGIYIKDNSNTVKCSWLGTRDGMTTSGGGIGLQLDGSNNQIGVAGVPESGNLISGNGGAGVRVSPGSKNNRFNNNWIGYKADGTPNLRNTGQGIKFLFSGNNGQIKFGVGNRIAG